MDTDLMNTLTRCMLFKSLIKDGCKWHGDILSRKWTECLYFTPDLKERVVDTLSRVDGLEYKLEDGAVWF